MISWNKASLCVAGTALVGYLVWKRISLYACSGDDAVLVSIGTAIPVELGAIAADVFRDIVQRMAYPPEILATVDKIVSRSGIDTRYTCISNNPETFVKTVTAGGRVRAEIWEEWAPKLAIRAAQDALSNWTRGSAQDITHVVVHSCTGFSAPGIDFALIQNLGLPSTTRKIPIHFAGCFGGFTGLNMAKTIVEADRTGKAVVLVVCAETCTAHMSGYPCMELVIGNTIFADGVYCKYNTMHNVLLYLN